MQYLGLCLLSGCKGLEKPFATQQAFLEPFIPPANPTCEVSITHSVPVGLRPKLAGKDPVPEAQDSSIIASLGRVDAFSSILFYFFSELFSLSQKEDRTEI